MVGEADVIQQRGKEGKEIRPSSTRGGIIKLLRREHDRLSQ